MEYHLGYNTQSQPWSTAVLDNTPERPTIALVGRTFSFDPSFPPGTTARTRKAVRTLAELLDGSDISMSVGQQGCDIEGLRAEEIKHESDAEIEQPESLLETLRRAQAAGTIPPIQETYSAHRPFVRDDLLLHSLAISKHVMDEAGLSPAPVLLLARSAVNMFANIEGGLQGLQDTKALLMGKTEYPYSPKFAENHTVVRITHKGEAKLGLREDPIIKEAITMLATGIGSADEHFATMCERAEELYTQGHLLSYASFNVEDLFTHKYLSRKGPRFVGEQNLIRLIGLANKEEQHKGVRFSGFDTVTLRQLNKLTEKDLPEYALETQPRHFYYQDPSLQKLAMFNKENPFDALSMREKKLELICLDIGYQNAFERLYPSIREERGEQPPQRLATKKVCEQQLVERDYLVDCLVNGRKLTQTRGYDFSRFTLERLEILETIISF